MINSKRSCAGRKSHASEDKPKVKFLIPEPTILHRRLSWVDFVKNDNRAEAVFFAPEQMLQFERFGKTFGKMDMLIKALLWDNVVLHHDLPEVLPLVA